MSPLAAFTIFQAMAAEHAEQMADGGFFAQGTIYPDRIESGKGDAMRPAPLEAR